MQTKKGKKNQYKNMTLITLLLTSCSIATASQITSLTTLGGGLCTNFLKSKQAKSQCNPSSRLISSLENVSPGISPLVMKQTLHITMIHQMNCSELSPFLQPKNCCKRSREENTLNSCESNNAGSKVRRLRINPLNGPTCFLAYTVHY